MGLFGDRGFRFVDCVFKEDMLRVLNFGTPERPSGDMAAVLFPRCRPVPVLTYPRPCVPRSTRCVTV